VNDSSTHDDDPGPVRPDRGGWLSGPALSEDEVKLRELRTEHPDWVLWFGRFTKSWWAAPPPPGQALINAPDLDALEAMILDIETWEGGRHV
jgi:hypothetical protein